MKVLVINFGENEEKYALSALQNLRAEGIACEIYPDRAKIGKQMNYANAKSIPFVVMAGEEEMNKQVYTLKNMESGEQQSMPIAQLVAYLKDILK